MTQCLPYCRSVMFSLCLATAAQAADTLPERGAYTGQGLVLHAQTRTPDQMAAFYTGRGFPAAML